MPKKAKITCYQIQGCQLDFRSRCRSWDKKVNCWDHKAEHPCCDRENWQRCERCEVWLAAEKNELPSVLVRLKIKKLQFP